MARLVQDGSWQATRERQLTAEPLCRMCREVGRLIPATVCDHIERHGGEPVRFWCGPFQSLCASCHSSEKQREERQRQAPSAIIPHYFNDTNVFGVSQGSTEFKDCSFRGDVIKTAYIDRGNLNSAIASSRWRERGVGAIMLIGFVAASIGGLLVTFGKKVWATWAGP
ncbi:MAG: hypothetical protein WBG88_09210 [Mesorhizobium sp.]